MKDSENKTSSYLSSSFPQEILDFIPDDPINDLKRMRKRARELFKTYKLDFKKNSPNLPKMYTAVKNKTYTNRSRNIIFDS